MAQDTPRCREFERLSGGRGPQSEPPFAAGNQPRVAQLLCPAWNDYIFTRILISSDELKTLPADVQDLFRAALIDWGLIMAAGMLITVPALAFFVVVQRHLVAGWGSGGLKG